MVDIIFYKFEKRRNSTKQPPTDSGTVVTCDFKSQVQLDAPIFMVEWESVPQWNYCKMFEYYYYITDITIVRNNLYLIRCVMDELASAKSNIAATRAFISYAADADNSFLYDGRVIASSVFKRDLSAKALAMYNETGTFAITCVGKGTTAAAFATGFGITYFMSRSEMQLFANKITTTDVWEELKQYFGEPLSAIIECYWLPVNVGALTDLTNTTIVLGEYDTGCIGHTVAATNYKTKSETTALSIPWFYDDFRRSEDFTKLLFYHPFVGAVPLSSIEWAMSETISVRTFVDFITGACLVELRDGAYLRQTVSGSIKVSLPFGRTDSRIGQLIGATTDMAAAIGSALRGDIANTSMGVLKSLSNFAKPVSSQHNGAYGGSTLTGSIQSTITLITMSYDSAEEPINLAQTVGRPFGKVDLIGNHSGFIETDGVSVSASFEAPIIDRINSALNGGIYYE